MSPVAVWLAVTLGSSLTSPFASAREVAFLRCTNSRSVMRLGIGSFTYPWAVGTPGHRPPVPLTPFGLLDRAIELGVGVVQFCDNLPLEALPEADLDALLVRTSAAAITLELGTRGIAETHLRAQLGLAVRIGSPVLRVVIDTADHQPSPEGAVGLLRQVAPDFERADVYLAVENHDRLPARVLADIVVQVDSPAVGVCLDTANSLGAAEGPRAVVETLAPFVVSVHVKDFAVRRMPHQLGLVVEGRPAGQGQLDIPALLEALRQAGRDPNAVVELWPPPESGLAATLAKEARWAAESVAYLRTLIDT